MPYARLLSAQLAVGAAAIFARYALAGAGPLAVSALRLAIAALPLVLFAALTRPGGSLGLRRELALAGAGLALAAHFGFWIGSLLYTSVAISTLLVATTPLWTEAYDALIARRPPARAYLLAIVLAALGLAAITLQHVAPAPVGGHALRGDLLALAGAFAMGAYLIVVRATGAQPTLGPAAIPTRAIVARTYGWAALALAVLAVAAHQPPPPVSATSAWLGIIAMALVSQLLGHTALNAALRDFTPSTVAMTTLLEPVSAAILAALIFRETLTLQTLAGGIAVLAAVGITLRATHVATSTDPAF